MSRCLLKNRCDGSRKKKKTDATLPRDSRRSFPSQLSSQETPRPCSRLRLARRSACVPWTVTLSPTVRTEPRCPVLSQTSINQVGSILPFLMLLQCASMRAIVVTRLGSLEELELQELPAPQPQTGGVLVNIDAAGINYADVLAIQGQYAGGPQPPYVPGREFAGTLTTTGERVMGYCDYGAFAEQVVAAPQRLWPVPPQFTQVQAAAFPVNFFTAFLTLWEAGLVEPQPDHEIRFPGGRRPRVLIHSVAGGVGTAAVQIGKALGLETYGTASTDSKIQGAFALGLEHGIVYTRQDYQALIKEQTKGEGVDAVLEMLGGEETARSIRCMGFLGRCILYGSASGQPPRFDPRELYTKAQSVWGFWLNRMISRPEPIRKAAESLLRWTAEGKLKPAVGHTLPLEQAGEGMRLLTERKAFGKVVLKVRNAES
jgi:NADPH:quinone reductase